MDGFRYLLSVILVVLVPMVIVFWLVIHGWISAWRVRGPRLAYSVAGISMVVVGAIMFIYRDLVLGPDLGTNWLLLSAGLIVYCASAYLAVPIRRHLSFRTFAGIPEVLNDSADLLQQGPFAVVRHPRYFMVLVGIAGWCLMGNYAGAYAVGCLSVAGLVQVIRLEERELLLRFGEDYRRYQQRVPRLFPSLRAPGPLLRTWSGR